MVKVRQKYHDEETGYIDPELWLLHLTEKRKPHEVELIRHAYSLANLSGTHQATMTGVSCLQLGLAIADILEQLDLDPETIATALVLPCVQYSELSLDDVSEQLTTTITKLVDGVIHMEGIRALQMEASHLSHNHVHIDKLRKMLLAMVEDVRVVLIKIAERTATMRNLKILPPAKQIETAREIHDIYAPLANRLGIGQIKWELEDLAFRYLEADTYKTIAKYVDQKRMARETYINQVIDELKAALNQAGVQHYKITGRAKHIYSIYRKMSRKDVDYSKIYDVSAVRILVSTIEDCYAALGVVHSVWQPIPEEFDDYIAHPKPNGYRSLHTAVVGPEQRNVEVQIRTYDIHQEAELGVAAHWIYKEGGGGPSSYDQKIAWLRQLIDWQKELTHQTDAESQPETKIFEDRVYVFTPTSEIVDLPIGATPLDFAYHIHTEVGHRVRGAKINGSIVPLTYQLKTGDRIEILTAKNPNPSRDWLNPNLHYLVTGRAKAKIHHWFKQLDYDKNRHDGHEILMRELDRLNIENITIDEIAKKFPQKNSDDFLAGIGAGDIRIGQLLHAIEVLEQGQQVKPDEDELFQITPKREIPRQVPKGITIQGIGNLLTTVAKCCHPVPGDPIVGYITQGRGVSIHRQDCMNVLLANEQHKERLIEVSWGEQAANYPVDIFIQAHDRHGLMRDVTTILANEKINVVALTCVTDKKEHVAQISLTVEIPNLTMLSRVFDRIGQIPNVFSVERQKT